MLQVARQLLIMRRLGFLSLLESSTLQLLLASPSLPDSLPPPPPLPPKPSFLLPPESIRVCIALVTDRNLFLKLNSSDVNCEFGPGQLSLSLAPLVHPHCLLPSLGTLRCRCMPGLSSFSYRTAPGIKGFTFFLVLP